MGWILSLGTKVFERCHECNNSYLPPGSIHKRKLYFGTRKGVICVQPTMCTPCYGKRKEDEKNKSPHGLKCSCGRFLSRKEMEISMRCKNCFME